MKFPFIQHYKLKLTSVADFPLSLRHSIVIKSTINRRVYITFRFFNNGDGIRDNYQILIIPLPSPFRRGVFILYILIFSPSILESRQNDNLEVSTSFLLDFFLSILYNTSFCGTYGFFIFNVSPRIAVEVQTKNRVSYFLWGSN